MENNKLIQNTKINLLPPELKPLSAGQYIWMLIFSVISPVNLFLGIYWCLGRDINVNKKAFGVAILFLYVLSGVIVGLIAILYHNVPGFAALMQALAH